MRALVIGGTPFIGRGIVERLVQRGHDVTVLHRRDRHDLGPQVRNLQADRSDLATVVASLKRERFEAVFDLAYDWRTGTPASDVEAVARHAGDQLQRYVFMSSIAAYGPGLDHRESDPLAPDDDPNPHVRHKASAERVLRRMHDLSGFPVVTFRTGLESPRQDRRCGGNASRPRHPGQPHLQQHARPHGPSPARAGAHRVSRR